jgi:hypothetical protein
MLAAIICESLRSRNASLIPAQQEMLSRTVHGRRDERAGRGRSG